MGWVSTGRAATALSRAAAANAKCFPITVRVIQVGKLQAAAYALQWRAYAGPSTAACYGFHMNVRLAGAGE